MKTQYTPEEIIDLQHDTWAYELKLWAEERQRTKPKRKWFLWLFALVIFAACSKDPLTPGPCYKCQAISQGRTYNETECGYNPESRLPESDAGGRLAWSCQEIR